MGKEKKHINLVVIGECVCFEERNGSAGEGERVTGLPYVAFRELRIPAIIPFLQATSTLASRRPLVTLSVSLCSPARASRFPRFHDFLCANRQVRRYRQAHDREVREGGCRDGQGLVQVRMGARQAEGRARARHHDRHCPVEVRDPEVLLHGD